jgi:hypothetical protein
LAVAATADADDDAEVEAEVVVVDQPLEVDTIKAGAVPLS